MTTLPTPQSDHLAATVAEMRKGDEFARAVAEWLGKEVDGVRYDESRGGMSADNLIRCYDLEFAVAAAYRAVSA